MCFDSAFFRHRDKFALPFVLYIILQSKGLMHLILATLCTLVYNYLHQVKGGTLEGAPYCRIQETMPNIAILQCPCLF